MSVREKAERTMQRDSQRYALPTLIANILSGTGGLAALSAFLVL